MPPQSLIWLQKRLLVFSLTSVVIIIGFSLTTFNSLFEVPAVRFIRITAKFVNDKLSNVLISSNFFIIPESNIVKLDEVLKCSPLKMNEVLKKIEGLYQETCTQTLGINAEDFAKGISKIKEVLESV